MMRTALALGLFGTACTVGEISTSLTDGAPGAALCVDRLADPQLEPHQHADGIGTHAGENCVSAACHGEGGTGPRFQFAGTVYKADRITPNAGVTVRVAGMTGMPPITDSAGNFSSTGVITFPTTTDVTACPTVTPMISALVQGGGDCNSCHRMGGAAGSVITLADPVPR